MKQHTSFIKRESWGRFHPYLGPVLFWSSILVFAWATYGLLRHRPFFRTWYYCFAWWSYILASHCVLHPKDPAALLRSLAETLRRVPFSITLWLIFEVFNFRLHNWHYVNLPEYRPIRWLGYALAFGTVLPGIFTTARVLERFISFRPIKTPASPDGAPWVLGSVFLGISCLAAALRWPRYFFPCVWIGFVFFLDPINHILGYSSFWEEIRGGRARKVLVYFASGAVCGILWETWNYWAGAKWIYTVPFVGTFKIFEMPALGFLGFPPFAMECFTMTQTSYAIGHAYRRLTSQHPTASFYLKTTFTLLWYAAVFTGIDHWTVWSYGFSF